MTPHTEVNDVIPAVATLSRRGLLSGSATLAATAAAFGLDHAVRPDAAVAAVPLPGAPRSQLVVVFLRGAIDGLSAAIPTAWNRYGHDRPNIAIAAGDTLPLDGADGWGLHPSLAPLLPEWNAGSLAVVQGAGNPHGARSHFREMQRMERGIASGDPGDASGWIGRHLRATDSYGNRGPFRGIAIEPLVPRSLAGYRTGLSIPDLATFRAPLSRQIGRSLENVAARDDPSHDVIRVSLELVSGVQGAVVPRRTDDMFGLVRMFADAATVLDSPLGTEVVTLSHGGWDTHDSMGTVSGGRMANQLGELAVGLRSFFDDLRRRNIDQRVTTVVLSEFGRRVRENGNGGTDHGKGTAMFIVGPTVRGGRIISKDLEGRQTAPEAPVIVDDADDVVVTTDYRDVLSEVVAHALADANPATIFPSTGTNRYVRRSVGVL